ncbi:MAG: hypothetical protein JRC86_06905 [Deltaproteobacteria bacterium]|nr:hypothetical protein [Deltaproteobacteria bacterium]
MPKETTQTENDQVEDSSASSDKFTNDSSGALNSTTEDAPTEWLNKDAQDDEEENNGDGDDEERTYTKEELNKLDLTFQQSPRFQKLQTKNDDLFRKNVELEARLKVTKSLEQVLEEDDDAQTPDLDYTDVTTLTPDGVIESFNSDPVSFMGNLARQVRSEVMTEVKTLNAATKAEVKQANEQSKVQKVYEKYEKDNPDFVTMWDNGEINTYMDENPGLTPMAAHKMMTLDSTIDAKVNEKLEEMTKKRRTTNKEPARTIGGGPQNGSSRVTKGVSPDLQDTKAHGGQLSVLTRRSLARTKGG